MPPTFARRSRSPRSALALAAVVLSGLAACDDPVEPRAQPLYLTVPADSVAPGDTIEVLAFADTSAGTAITSSSIRFTSSDTLIAVVDSLTGRVVVRGDGDVTITARDQRRSGSTTLRSYIRPLETGGVRFVQLAIGRLFGCGLDAAGAAYCWGTNNLGQLGNGVRGTGTTIFGVGPVLQHGSYSRISAGRGGGCGIMAAGDVECWGDALVGLVSPTARTAPRSIALPASFGRVVDVRIGVRSNVCVIDEAGAHLCWGDNVYGAIGGVIVGPTGILPVTSPQPVPGAPSGIRAIATGELHGCAIDTAAALWCWGANTSWGPENPSDIYGSAVAVPDAPAFTQLVAGFEQTCGLDASGKAWCAGYDDGLRSFRAFTAIASPSPFVRLAGGFDLACGLTAAGEALCWNTWDWGRRYSSIFGYGTAVPLSRRHRFVDVSAGPHAACGLTAEGLTFCRDNPDFHANFQ